MAPLVPCSNRIPGGGSGVLVERALLEETGWFDPALRNLADWDLYIRLALHAPLAPVRKPLLAYVRHAQGMSRGLHDIDDELRYVERKYVHQRADLGVDIDWAIWSHWIAGLHLRSGHRGEALQRLVQATRHERTPSLAVRAMAMLAAPRLTDWVRRRRRRPSPEREAEIETWLAPLRR